MTPATPSFAFPPKIPIPTDTGASSTEWSPQGIPTTSITVQHHWQRSEQVKQRTITFIEDRDAGTIVTATPFIVDRVSNDP
tara:strand:+ start:303 stop:545 length:243 start_codon:yes stop_codon:yes gene_type:complete